MLTTQGQIVSDHASDLDSVISHSLKSIGEDHNDKGKRGALDEVYRDDPALYEEDKAAWLAAKQFAANCQAGIFPTRIPVSNDDAVVSAGITSDTNASPIIGVSAAQAVANEHSAGITRIVGLIRAKYEDEGERNFAIGKEALDLAIRQRHEVGEKSYTSSDFDCQVNRIRDEVRMFVSIKPESIRIPHWVRCHAMREEVGKAITPERASKLSMHEYMAISGKGFRWNSADLAGTINPCWLDMIRGVADDRAAGTIVKREDVANRIVATESRANAAKLAALDPAKAATKVASDAVRANATAVKNTIDAITKSVDTGIASGAIKPEGALAILEGVAKFHKMPLVAASIGFDPATATSAEWESAIAVAFNAGKLTELKAAVAKASKAIATMEKAASKAATAKPTASKPTNKNDLASWDGIINPALDPVASAA
jgi:hypothetical protein